MIIRISNFFLTNHLYTKYVYAGKGEDLTARHSKPHTINIILMLRMLNFRTNASLIKLRITTSVATTSISRARVSNEKVCVYPSHSQRMRECLFTISKKEDTRTHRNDEIWIIVWCIVGFELMHFLAVLHTTGKHYSRKKKLLVRVNVNEVNEHTHAWINSGFHLQNK